MSVRANSYPQEWSCTPEQQKEPSPKNLLSLQAIRTSLGPPYKTRAEVTSGCPYLHWDCLIMHTSWPLPQFFYLNLNPMSVPQRWFGITGPHFPFLFYDLFTLNKSLQIVLFILSISLISVLRWVAMPSLLGSQNPDFCPKTPVTTPLKCCLWIIQPSVVLFKLFVFFTMYECLGVMCSCSVCECPLARHSTYLESQLLGLLN